MKKKAQNIIEFVFIFPLLFVVILVIIEVAMFWKSVSVVQNIALKAGSNAVLQPITSNMTTVSPSDTDCSDGACSNFVVAKALEVVKNSHPILGVGNLTYTCSVKTSSGSGDSTYYGTPPFAYYDCKSSQSNNGVPTIELTVDTRSVSTHGVITQLTFNYHTFILSASVPLPDGSELVVIPETVPISSTKVISNSEL